MNKEYAHYSNYPWDEKRWPNFKPIELRSKSDNKLMVDRPSLDKLQALRSLLRVPFGVTSAYRSPAHNKKVKGAAGSMHLKALAYDIRMKGINPALFLYAAEKVGFTGIGFYQKSNFIHIDTGPKRTWGKRWFAELDPVVAEKMLADLYAAPAREDKAPVTAAVAIGGAAATLSAKPELWPYVAGVAVVAIAILIWRKRK